MAKQMQRLMGVPTPQGPSPEQVALQQQQSALLTAQKTALDQQEAQNKAATDRTAAAGEADAVARARRARGRVSLLNDDVGIVLTPTPGDLQRRLGG